MTREIKYEYMIDYMVKYRMTEITPTAYFHVERRGGAWGSPMLQAAVDYLCVNAGANLNVDADLGGIGQ
jgi:hypothetical protein